MKRIIRYIPFLLLLSLVSCKTIQYVPQIEYRDSVRYVTSIDSIKFTSYDSIYIKERGDTVFMERWKTVFKDRISVKTDTIKITTVKETPYPVEVEKKLTASQKFKLTTYRYILILLVVLAVYLAYDKRKAIIGIITRLIIKTP